jgi:hypothetical protein
MEKSWANFTHLPFQSVFHYDRVYQLFASKVYICNLEWQEAAQIKVTEDACKS